MGWIANFQERNERRVAANPDSRLRETASRMGAAMRREQATPWLTERENVREDGSFARGVCPHCDWAGPGRRARSRAERDAKEHAATHK